MSDVPAVRFAQARGARIAYQDFGSGDHTMVSVPPLAQNIERAWEWPAIRHMLEREASFCRMIVFDKRGTGSSDRRSRVPGLDERVDDMRAVFDAADIDRAHVYAASGGGPTAIMFAVTYPERVSGLILHDSGARVTPTELTDELITAQHTVYQAFATSWGTPDSPVVPMFAPSEAGNAEFRAWHERYERTAADGASLMELLTINLEIDVRDVLGLVSVPTLVLHATQDPIMAVELGREAAAAIPGARLVEYDSVDHFQYVGDLERWMPELERFITGSVSAPPRGRPERSDVAIATLGGFGVTRNGEPVPSTAWGSRLARQLCKRLVAARGWPVTRDQLIEQLWPDEYDRRKLGARLSVQLSSVRRVLGGGVRADRETVALDLDEVSTDLEAFFRGGDDDAVVAAFTGPFLPEDVYEDWSGPIRDETSRRFVAAALRHAETALAGGDHEAAVGACRRVIELEPYEEAAHRLLVEALLGSGATGAARTAHARWAGSMGELDIEIAGFEEFTTGD